MNTILPEKKHTLNQNIANFLNKHKLTISFAILFIILLTSIFSTIFKTKYSLKKENPVDLKDNQILALLPQPADAQEPKKDDDSNNENDNGFKEKTEEKQNSTIQEMPSTGTPTKSDYKTPIVENPIYTTEPVIPQLQIVTLAPINNSRVAGKHFYIAFSTNNPSFAWIESIQHNLIDKTTKISHNQISIPNHSQFSLTHTLPVKLNYETQSIKINLKLVDLNNNQTKTSLFYTK